MDDQRYASGATPGGASPPAQPASVYDQFTELNPERIETAPQVAVTYAYACELTADCAGMGIDYGRMFKASLGSGYPSGGDPLIHVRLLRARLDQFLDLVRETRGKWVSVWARYTVENVTLADLSKETGHSIPTVWRNNKRTIETIERLLEKGKL